MANFLIELSLHLGAIAVLTCSLWLEFRKANKKLDEVEEFILRVQANAEKYCDKPKQTVVSAPKVKPMPLPVARVIKR